MISQIFAERATKPPGGHLRVRSHDLDLIHHADSDAAIEQLYLDGIDDAIEGKYPYSREWEYLKGYGEGLKQVQARMRCELALLKGEASEVEALLEEF